MPEANRNEHGTARSGHRHGEGGSIIKALSKVFFVHMGRISNFFPHIFPHGERVDVVRIGTTLWGAVPLLSKTSLPVPHGAST